jgi:hypothetical protein
MSCNIDKFHRNVTLLTRVCQVWTVDFQDNVKVGYSWHR